MIFTSENIQSPKQVLNVFDIGYLGMEKDFPEQKSSIPNRKKRNLKLSSKEKKYNHKNPSIKRIVIEHTICKLKKYRIMSGVFRNRLRKYDKISDIVQV